jgi:hypothetical protein
MRLKDKDGITLVVISLFIFLCGTFLSMMNHWPRDPLTAHWREYGIAIGMAGCLTVAEVMFVRSDIALADARKWGKKALAAVCMISLACTMCWTIASEWRAADGEDKAKLTFGALNDSAKNATGASRSRSERLAIQRDTMQSIQTVAKSVFSPDYTAYQANLLVGLIVACLLHFTKEKVSKRQRTIGNPATDDPRVREKVSQIGFQPETVKAYKVKGGYALHQDGKYKKFIPDKALGDESLISPPGSV